jgi:hypothetical protein
MNGETEPRPAELPNPTFGTHNELSGYVDGPVVQVGINEGNIHIHPDTSGPPTQDRTVTAQALLRGPVNAIEGLAELVSTADRSATTDPITAATTYSEVAITLNTNGYHGHSLLMRQRAATVLEDSGHPADSARLLILLIEEMIGAGEAGQAGAPVHQLRRLVRSEDLPNKARAEATLVLYDTVQHPLDDLSRLIDTFETLTGSGDLAAGLYAMVLAESAVAANRLPKISNSITTMTRVADNVDDIAMKTRIHLAVADADGNWAGLCSSARRHQFPPALNALVLARYARHLTLTANPDEAADYWWEAINQGALAGLGDDTAEWLYAVRENTLEYGPINGDFETHHLAQAMRASGGNHVLPSARNHYKSALEELRMGNLRPACQAARRALYESVTAAHLHSEHLAARLLADIYAQAEPELAAAQYVRTGQSKALCTMLSTAVDRRIDLLPFFGHPAPWQRATAYAGETEQADLLPDNQVSTLLDAALEEFNNCQDGRVRQSPFAPNVTLAALDLIAALIERGSPDQASRALDLLSSSVTRRPNHYRHSDTAHIKTLLGILRSHPQQRAKSAAQLLQILALNAPVSDDVVRLGSSVIAQHPDLFSDQIVQLSTDHPASARLITHLEHQLSAEHPLVVQAYERLLTPYQSIPGNFGVGLGLARQTALVRHLPPSDCDAVAGALLVRARDHSQPAANRAEALDALRSISDAVSSVVREELFEIGLSFSDGTHDGSAFDDEFGGTPHPLSMFRVSFGDTSLALPGLQLAAATCPAHKTAQVEQRALRFLGSTNDAVVHGAVLSLLWLSRHTTIVTEPPLASHPNPNVRALVAIGWVRQRPRDPDLGRRLARDNSPIVRRSLATELVGTSDKSTDNEIIDVRGILAQDKHYSVRSIVASHLT